MVFSIVGSLVGSFFGPVGRLVGGTIGAIIDTFLYEPDPIIKEGSRLRDLTQKAHSPGVPIPIVYGTTRVNGSVIWTSGLIEDRHEETESVPAGGKGAPTQDVTTVTYTYRVDAAVLICEGPIYSVNKIWAGPKLIYDNGTSSFATITFSLGAEDATPSSMIEAYEGDGNVPPFRGMAVAYFNDLQLTSLGLNTTPPFSFLVQRSEDGDDLQYVTGDLCSRAGLASNEYNVSGLTKDEVKGFVLVGLTTARSAIQALQQAFLMDTTDTGYELKFRRRNRFSDIIVKESDLAAHDLESGYPAREETNREQDRKIPAEINFQYLDPDREYTVNMARSRRLITDSRDVLSLEPALTMNNTDAQLAADNLNAELWLQKTTKIIHLPPKYIEVDAGDILYLERSDGVLEKFRVQEASMGANGVIELRIFPHVHRWLAGTPPATSGTFTVQSVAQVSQTAGYFLDLPILRDVDEDSNGFYFAAEDLEDGNTWRGGVLFRSIDGGTTFTSIGRFDFPVTVGTATTVLADGPTEYVDRKNTVTVNFSYGAPSSVTDDQFRNKVNIAVLGSEIIGFRDATLVSGTTYRLSHLSRGHKGTNHATGSHASSETFVLLTTSTIRRFDQDLSYLNKTLPYKPVTFGLNLSDVTAVNFKNTGIWAKPWSVAHIFGTRNIPSSNDWTITWDRRNRQNQGWNDFGEIQMTEASESYEIDIMDGATVKRTLTSTDSETGIVYTEAQQITDFGAAQSSIEVNIYQISAIVGRGYVRNETVS